MANAETRQTQQQPWSQVARDEREHFTLHTTHCCAVGSAAVLTAVQCMMHDVWSKCGGTEKQKSCRLVGARMMSPPLKFPGKLQILTLREDLQCTCHVRLCCVPCSACMPLGRKVISPRGTMYNKGAIEHGAAGLFCDVYLDRLYSQGRRSSRLILSISGTQPVFRDRIAAGRHVAQ